MILTLTAQREGKLVSFLRGELKLSSTLTTRLKYRDAYRVNGETVHIHHRIHIGDVITVDLKEAPPDYPAEAGELSILYEDDALIVLDKPAGLLMHPTFHRLSGTLANRLLAYYQQTGQECAIHLVNRLDRDTFGVVLIAKNSHTHAILCDALQSGSIEKVYQAVVYGAPPQQEGILDAPIDRLDPTSLLRCIREGGQSAQTFYRVLDENESCTLLELHPLTGRTHQLRLHCSHFGFPILGDPQYGSEASQNYSLARGLTHQQLCAVSLSFPHPLEERIVTVHSKQSVKLI